MDVRTIGLECFEAMSASTVDGRAAGDEICFQVALAVELGRKGVFFVNFAFMLGLSALLARRRL